MKITLLGTGTSTGVPQIGCPCPTCRSTDARDRRLRASALVETESERLLIDCGPDFRAQVLALPFRPLTAVLLTHEHYDHVGGLDDLRPFCRLGSVSLVGEALCLQHVRERMPYCFAEHKYRGVPEFTLREVQAGTPIYIGRTQVLPLRAMHGKLPITGFRIGAFAYITDASALPQETIEALHGIDTLVLNALRPAPHPTHFSLSEAIDAARVIGARRTYFTHFSHEAGLHADLLATLPTGIAPACDGMVIETA